MAKQTFTTGQVLTAAQMTSLQQTAMLGGAASAKVASYVLVAADAGDAITMSNAGATTITVDTGLFATGDIVTIINIGAGACTITAGTATVTTSGSLVLAQNQGGVLRFTSPSAAIFLQFATPASGDIEGVTAGVGISGGGTSGTVTVTNSMATAITTAGDLIKGTGSGTFDRLGIGSAGNVLTVAGGVPTWAAPAGGGKIAQVVSVTTTSSNSTTSNTFQDCNGLTATITPTSATSKVMVLIQANLNGFYTGDNSGQFDLAIANSAGTVIYDLGRTNWWEENTSSNKRFFTTIPLMYLHSPATTSATTYKLQMRIRFGGTVSFNDQTNISSITLMEVLA